MELVAGHIDYKALYEQSQLDILYLRQELDQLKKMIFGPTQERFIANATDATQLAVGLESEVVAATSVVKAQKVEYTRSKAILSNPASSHRGRMKLSEHLERKEILVGVAHPEDRPGDHRRIGIPARKAVCEPLCPSQICPPG